MGSVLQTSRAQIRRRLPSLLRMKSAKQRLMKCSAWLRNLLRKIDKREKKFKRRMILNPRLSEFQRNASVYRRRTEALVMRLSIILCRGWTTMFLLKRKTLTSKKKSFCRLYDLSYKTQKLRKILMTIFQSMMSSKGCKLKGGSPPNVGLSGSEGCRMQRFVHLKLHLGGIFFSFDFFKTLFLDCGVMTS